MIGLVIWVLFGWLGLWLAVEVDVWDEEFPGRITIIDVFVCSVVGAVILVIFAWELWGSEWKDTIKKIGDYPVYVRKTGEKDE